MPTVNGFKLWSLLAAAVVLFSPAAAFAQDSSRQLSATVHVGLTILPSVTVGTRARLRGGSDLFVGDFAGDPMASSEFSVVYRDARGERVLRDQGQVAAALEQSAKAGDREVEITLVF